MRFYSFNNCRFTFWTFWHVIIVSHPTTIYSLTYAQYHSHASTFNLPYTKLFAQLHIFTTKLIPLILTPRLSLNHLPRTTPKTSITDKSQRVQKAREKRAKDRLNITLAPTQAPQRKCLPPAEDSSRFSRKTDSHERREDTRPSTPTPGSQGRATAKENRSPFSASLAEVYIYYIYGRRKRNKTARALLFATRPAGELMLRRCCFATASVGEFSWWGLWRVFRVYLGLFTGPFVILSN